MPEEASYRLQPSQMNCSEMAAFRARTILRVPTSDCSFYQFSNCRRMHSLVTKQ